MMLRFFLITILLTDYVKVELKAEAAPSVCGKGLEKKSSEERQLDHLKQAQDNVWNQPVNLYKTKNPSKSRENEGTDLKTLDHDSNRLGQKINDHKRRLLPKFPEVQFTPQDLAEYIVRTGDEKSVASAIRNLLRSRTLSRHDALSFLQEVEDSIPEVNRKSLPKTEESAKNSVQYFVNRRNEELLKQTRQKKVERSSRDGITTDTPLTTALLFVETFHSSRSYIKESAGHISTNHSKLIKHMTPTELHNEIVMRNVIYKLAKEMFLHSLASGDKGAKTTLTKLMTTLEKDVHSKIVPQKVKDIILESISTALVDSLKGYRGIFSKRHTVNDGSLRQRRNVMIRKRKA